MVTWSGKLELTSPAFSDGGEIPRECGYKNGNQKPSLRITVDGGKELGATGIDSLALIMDDPDAMEAVGKVWVHWVVWHIIPEENDYASGTRHDEIENLFMDRSEGFSLKGKPHTDRYYEGMTDFDERGYGGPAPPDKRHTYVFKLYALDCKELTCAEPKATKADVEKAMEGHIIEQATLTGTYAP